MTDRRQELHRAIGPLGITVYAVGDILGAGIYALVGGVVGLAEGAAWLSFVLAAFIAGLTGLTYAELVSRFPVAAGAAAYCRRAYRAPLVAFIVGFFVLAAGITSAAAVSRAVVGYLDAIVVLPDLAVSIALLALMSAISYRGIRESASVNFALTAVELSGLLLVIVVGLALWAGGSAPPASVDTVTGATPAVDVIHGILAGTTIAFFAYVGFEDVVNVAEEVKDAGRVIPRAILIAIASTTAVYLSVVGVALATVPMAELAGSDAPLLEVFEAADIAVPDQAFAIVALLAITNTGLLNLIMASRLTYGMSNEGLLPEVLSRVHARRRTPFVAILVVFVLAIALAVSGETAALAQTTSLLLLLVFGAVHVALIVVARREPAHSGFRAPRWVPWLGVLVCGAMTTQYPLEVYVRALLVLATASIAYIAVGRSPRCIPSKRD